MLWQGALHSACLLLLISPYWNVNFRYSFRGAAVKQLLISPYWNVNEVWYSELVNAPQLLISPYWNVNYHHGWRRASRLRLLISPYWNVNIIKRAPAKPTPVTFNLSILECKWKHWHNFFCEYSKLLISPYWNVNSKWARTSASCRAF